MLSITNGGSVSNTYDGLIGYCSGSVGSVTVSGAGSTWTNSRDLTVGYSGSGALSIMGGGRVSNNTSDIGRSVGGVGFVTVSGTGSTWTNSKSLTVGYYGSGTLNITSGGSVSNSYGYIGYGSASTGSVMVSGTSSTWTNSSRLFVGGNSSSGTLSISGGGAVSASGVSVNNKSLMAIDVGHGSSLAVGGSSGTISNDGTIRVLGRRRRSNRCDLYTDCLRRLGRNRNRIRASAERSIRRAMCLLHRASRRERPGRRSRSIGQRCND